MRKLLQRFDVDVDQWRVLTRTLLQMDFRTTAAAGAQFNRKISDNPGARVALQSAFYFLMGGAVSVLVFAMDDMMVSASITLTYVMFMVGMMVLVDHQSVITSPDDYLVLGPRPVSSRTYFAVRLTNVLVYALGLTTVFGILPMLSFGLAHGVHPARGVAAVMAFYMATLLLTLTLVWSYASLVRFVGANRLARILSYAQLIVGVITYGGYMLPGRIVRFHGLNPTMPETPWAFLFPPTWFASYIAIAAGSAGLRHWVAAGASIVALLLVGRGLTGRLSLDYASRLGAILSATAASAGSRQRSRRPWIFKSGEHRVVSLLVRAQFRNDQKFRMAVLGVLPLTIVYMFMTFQDGPPADPFGGSARGMMSWMPLTMAVIFFPMMLRLTLTASDAYRAAWIYFGTPVSRARILRAQTDVLMMVFILPYVLAVGATMGYFSGHVAGDLTHVIVLGLISRLMLQAVTATSPVMPFSQPQQKTRQSGGVMGWMFLTMLSAAVIGPLLVLFVYGSAIRIAMMIVILLALSVLLDRLTRARLGEEAEQLEFDTETRGVSIRA